MSALALAPHGAPDVWTRLAAPLPAPAISWRQDGKAKQGRDGKWYARFVAYVDAGTVRERLDAVVPGEWSLTLELLPPVSGGADADGEAVCVFKARLQVKGIVREDVGTGRDHKAASTDSFKRAAVRFGIGHELYAYEQNWVAVDGDGKYAKPLEDPAAAYARQHPAR
ncbi:MAG TPA: Rad52/Rad22 family DNA repair protein [Gemmatimonadaceae bacterium]|nr:Rad52/Rad22 family DNA repair protein [Gemmatimonadaceae bacterium]